MAARRRLTRQQARRIAGSQREHARRATGSGTAETVTDGFGPESPGRVAAHYGGQVEVAPERAGDAGATSLRCHLRTHLGALVVGDRVVYRPGTPTGVVVARLPRDSLLERPDARGVRRAVAANVDQLVIVFAARPQPHGDLLDRYLVAAEAMGAEPLLLLNKTDLLADRDLAEALNALLAPYGELGYRLLRTRRETAAADLGAALRGRTSILVGQSGVGKTSLVNALLPGVGRATGALSGSRYKGRHTTTTAELHDLPGGGRLIDSPGIREFGLDHLPAQTVAAGFREFRPFLGRCRFRDCRHGEEPGCALLAAVARGVVSEQRLASYRRILAASPESGQPP